LGTGNRASLSGSDVADVFVAFKNYWDGDGVIETRAIEHDLVDLTENLIQEGTEEQKAEVKQVLLDESGWDIELEGDGEKLVASPVVYDNAVYFTTYTPPVYPEPDPCSSTNVRGIARLYSLNIDLDKAGTPKYDFNGDGQIFGRDDRSFVIGWGIPSAPVIAVKSNGAYLYAAVEGGVWSHVIEIDTDYDELPDHVENLECTDVNDADTDDDGIMDGVEDQNHNGTVDTGETDPCNADSDGDGLQDGTELGYTTGNTGPDTDTGVFIPDNDPSATTDPLNIDSDFDGIDDGYETFNGLDPLTDDALGDLDNDGYCNLREYLAGTDPGNELEIPSIIADIDFENDADGADLKVFSDEYGRIDCSFSNPCGFDLDGDGDVDDLDLRLFTEDYGRVEW